MVILEYPEICTVVINHNGETYLRKCFGSIVSQDYPEDKKRIMVVDNSSEDGSIDFIEKNYANVEVIESGGKLGYAGGANVGYRRAGGKYVILMANDVILPKNWTKNMVELMENREDVAAATTVMINGETTNAGLGDVVNASPVLVGKSDASDSNYTVVPWGGACIVRKDLFDVPFDADYFLYGEDVYLGLLSWLKGFKVVVGRMNVAHLGSVTVGFSSYTQVYYNERNRLTNLLLFFKRETILMLSPLIVFDIIIRFLYFLRTNRLDLVKAEGSAILWNIKNIRKNLKKRLVIQSARKVDDCITLDVLCEKLYGKGGLKDFINVFATSYFRLIKRVCRRFRI